MTGFQHDREVFLVRAKDEIEARMMESLLNDHDIPVMKKYASIDGYMKIIAGETKMDVDLYVPSRLLDKSREIIESAMGGV